MPDQTFDRTNVDIYLITLILSSQFPSTIEERIGRQIKKTVGMSFERKGCCSFNDVSRIFMKATQHPVELPEHLALHDSSSVFIKQVYFVSSCLMWNSPINISTWLKHLGLSIVNEEILNLQSISFEMACMNIRDLAHLLHNDPDINFVEAHKRAIKKDTLVTDSPLPYASISYTARKDALFSLVSQKKYDNLAVSSSILKSYVLPCLDSEAIRTTSLKRDHFSVEQHSLSSKGSKVSKKALEIDDIASVFEDSEIQESYSSSSSEMYDHLLFLYDRKSSALLSTTAFQEPAAGLA